MEFYLKSCVCFVLEKEKVLFKKNIGKASPASSSRTRASQEAQQQPNPAQPARHSAHVPLSFFSLQSLTCGSHPSAPTHASRPRHPFPFLAPDFLPRRRFHNPLNSGHYREESPSISATTSTPPPPLHFPSSSAENHAPRPLHSLAGVRHSCRLPPTFPVSSNLPSTSRYSLLFPRVVAHLILLSCLVSCPGATRSSSTPEIRRSNLPDEQYTEVEDGRDHFDPTNAFLVTSRVPW